jgi:hypothetical protein
MTHREDPNRGVWKDTCHFCGVTTKCRLVMYGDRYVWKCLGFLDCGAGR